MAKCANCGSNIFIGGVTAGGQRFCNNKCYRDAYVLSVSQQVPTNIIDQKTGEIWRGMCPQCLGAGPVDVHRFHEVWSALVLTRWVTKSQVSCRSCAKKKQLGGMFLSLVAGWWGFPWGLIMTPVQVGRNISEMSGGPTDDRPSDNLRKSVVVALGSQMIAAQQQGRAAAAKPAPSTAAPPPIPPANQG